LKIKWLTDNKKRAGLYIALLLLAFLTEVGLFNLSSIRTLRGGAGIELTDRFSVSEEAAYNAADGSYTAGAEEFTMYMGEVNADIKNLYIDMDFEDTAVANSIYLTDEGNVLAYKLPEHYLLKGRGREDSQYVTLHPYGKVRTIKMVFQVMPVESFRINQISMNVSKPFQIEPLRVAVIYGVFVFAAIFRRKSKLHQIAFRPESKKQWAAGVFIMGIFLALATGAFRSNLEYWTGMGGNQYHALTRALSEGHFSLDYSVPDELLQLENPYDMNTWDGIDVYWDNAFYNGKYYCYFGITPVLLLYLPCYLLTGTMLQNHTASLIFLISMITGSFYLVRQILKRWGDGKVPFFVWPLLSGLLCFSENFFLLTALGVFALISLCCGGTLPLLPEREHVRKWLGLGIGGLLAVYAVLLGLNMRANQLFSSISSSPDPFGTLKSIVVMDRFEWKDYMLTYVYNAVNVPQESPVRAQADEYAAQLMQAESNSAPLYVARYYFGTDQVQKGFAALEKYGTYVVSDPDTWKEIFQLLESEERDTGEFREGVARLYQILQDWNATSIGPVKLSEQAEAFVQRVAG